MARHEAFQLSERKDVGADEERAGLLADAEVSELSSDTSDAEELGPKEDCERGPLEPTSQRLKRNWLRWADLFSMHGQQLLM